ncbi:MAG TPA: antitoxin [Thermoanaerobaculia bacterium]|nr:antitoxin [Thermoanaerobaculia bacterium]
MRTTLDIADDVLIAVKERARREHRSAGEVISDLARQALQARIHTDAIADGDSFYGFRPLPHRGGTVSNDLIDRLRDEED